MDAKGGEFWEVGEWTLDTSEVYARLDGRIPMACGCAFYPAATRPATRKTNGVVTQIGWERIPARIEYCATHHAKETR